MSLDDLRDNKGNKETEHAYKKFKLVIDEVEGMNAKTSFYGLTTNIGHL